MTKQQCETCMEWFEDSELDAHLQRHLEEALLSDEEREQLRLKCPICNGLEFERESGSLEGSWLGQTRHKMVLMICRKCSLVLPFYEGRTLLGWIGTRKFRGVPMEPVRGKDSASE